MYDSNNFGVSDDYEYHEILIDSRDALTRYSSAYTSLNWPKILLGKELERVAAVKVLQVVIPNTFYNVTPQNQSFRYFTYVNVGVPTWFNQNAPATLTIGKYTKTELEAEASSKLTALTIAAATSIFQSITDLPSQMKSRYLFSTSTNSSRTYMMGMDSSITPSPSTSQIYSAINNNARDNPRRLLGWEGASGTPNFASLLTGSGVSVYTGTQVVGLGITSANGKKTNTPFVTEIEPRSIYLNSKTLGSMINNIHLNGNSHMVPPNTGGDEEQICSIPVPSTTGKGENIVYSDPDPQKWFKFGGNLSFPTSFDFYLTSGVNVEPLDLNGSSFIVKLGVLTNKREFERTFPTSSSGGYERVRNLIVTK